MKNFRNLLQQEYMKRVGKNPHYSIRAFAKSLGIHHATLSAMMAGKRSITNAAILRLSKALGLSPEEVNIFIQAKVPAGDIDRVLLENDIFSFMSEWYYDAILELSLVPKVGLNPASISSLLDIPVPQAAIALETLERLELLQKDENDRYVITHKHTTNILDPDQTSGAQKKYQKSILEKSIEAIDKIDRKERDHTSTTIAVMKSDLPEAKKIIKKFRQDMSAFLQRDESLFDDVYQLQVAFFPLTSDKRVHQ